MSFSIKKNVITITRGDTLVSKVAITDAAGNEYVPCEEDSIRFALKQSSEDEEALIVKEIPYDTLILQLDADETKQLPVGEYRYDIEITLSNGVVDTFIPWSKFKVTEEVI